MLYDVYWLPCPTCKIFGISFETDPPTEPLDVQLTEVLKKSATVSWKPPSSDGGSPITGYFIERCLAGTNRWIRITKDLVTAETYTDKEVVEDNAYQYRVTAVNKIGAGPPSQPTAPVTIKDPWGR